MREIDHDTMFAIVDAAVDVVVVTATVVIVAVVAVAVKRMRINNDDNDAAVLYDGDFIVYRSRYNTWLERLYDGDKRNYAPPLLLLLSMLPLPSPLMPSVALMLLACESSALSIADATAAGVKTSGRQAGRRSALSIAAGGGRRRADVLL